MRIASQLDTKRSLHSKELGGCKESLRGQSTMFSLTVPERVRKHVENENFFMAMPYVLQGGTLSLLARRPFKADVLFHS